MHSLYTASPFFSQPEHNVSRRQPSGQPFAAQSSDQIRDRIRDWTRPTNAVPGVADMQELQAGQAETQQLPRTPVLTLQGFGGRSSVIHLPGQLHSVPGVGEDMRSWQTAAYGSTAASTETSARVQAFADTASSAGLPKTSLHRAMYASACSLVAQARQAGAAVRSLCLEMLARNLQRAEQAAAGIREQITGQAAVQAVAQAHEGVRPAAQTLSAAQQTRVSQWAQRQQRAMADDHGTGHSPGQYGLFGQNRPAQPEVMPEPSLRA